MYLSVARFISDCQIASVYLGSRRFPFTTQLWYVPILETNFQRENTVEITNTGQEGEKINARDEIRGSASHCVL